MAKMNSHTVSSIYSGAYTRGVDRGATAILSRKKKGKVKNKSEKEEIRRRAEKKASRVSKSIAAQRRIALEWFRSKRSAVSND